MKRQYLMGLVAVVLAAILIFFFFSNGVESPQGSSKNTSQQKATSVSESATKASSRSDQQEASPQELSLQEQSSATSEAREKSPFSGFVRDASLDTLPPIAGATVQAFHFPDNIYSNQQQDLVALAETVSKADGSFAFEGFSWNLKGTLAYHIEMDGFNSLIKLFPQGDGLDNLALTTFMMYPANSIEGIVIDQNGKPISNVHVGNIVLEDNVGGLLTGVPGTYVSSWTKTDSQGNFKLTGIPLPDRDPKRPRAARMFQLPAFAFGYSKGLSSPVTAGTKDVKIQLFKSEGSLYGTVLTHDRKKVAGATVVLTPEAVNQQSNRPLKLESITDENGVFEFPDLLAGSYDLSATKSEPQSLGFDPISERKIVVVRGSKNSEEILFPAPVTLSGTVVSAEAQAIPGFTFHTKIDEVIARSKAPTVVTDASGFFQLNLYVPAVGNDVGFSPRIPISLPQQWLPATEQKTPLLELTSQDIIFQGLHPGEIRENLIVTLDQGAPISGLVYEPDGKTLAADTTVFFRGTKTFGTVQTTNRGEYQLLAVPGEELTLEASSTLGAAAVVATAPKEKVDIVMKEYASISGHVRGKEGKPLQGYEVRVSRIASAGKVSTSIRFEEFALTDAEGAYLITLVAPDSLSVNLMMSTNTEYVVPKPINLSPAPAEKLTNIDFNLETGDYVEGYVYNEAGEPLEAVSLLTSDTRLSAQTDEKGYFKLIGIPVDQPIAFVSASKRGFEEQTKKNVTIYDGLIKFNLKTLGDVSIVAQTSGGAPVTDYKLRLFKTTKTPSGPRQELIDEKAISDSTGIAKIPDLQPSDYRVEVIQLSTDGSESANRGSQEFSLSKDSTQSGKEIIVTLSGGRYLVGTVVDQSTKSPSSNATVVLLNVPQNATLEGATYEGPPYDRTARFRVNQSGQFKIGPLTDGSYILQAESDTSYSVLQEVQLSSTPDQIVLELVKSPVVVGTIINKNGDLMKSATVLFAKGNSPPDGSPLTAINGAFEKKLPGTGEWRIIVNEDGTPNNQTKLVTFNSGEVKEVTFSFSNEVTLTGSLLINGQPAEVSNLVLRGQDGNEAYVRLESTGNYTAQVTPGVYQPWIIGNDVSAPAGSTVSIPDGKETAEHDFALNLATLDLLIDTTEQLAGAVLELKMKTQQGTITVATNYPIDRASIRFTDVPAGDYQGTVMLKSGTILKSSWTAVQSGQENSLVILPSN